MAVDEKLLAKARQNPADLTFEEAVSLAEQLGWEEERTRGSHKIFHHPSAPKIRNLYPRPLNLQRGKDDKAKGYQVRQMIKMAVAMGAIKAE